MTPPTDSPDLPPAPRQRRYRAAPARRRARAGSAKLAFAALLAPLATAATVPQDVLHERWLARYDGPVHDVDQLEGLAVLPQGGACVTGTSVGLFHGQAAFGIATLRYDTGGRALWTSRYDRTVFDAAAGLATDAAGNVYVVGSTIPDPPWPDILLIKYDAHGVFQWDWSYDEFDNNDEGVDLAVDPAGNVVVVGHANGLTGADFYTVKLDPDGNELWAARYHGGAQSPKDLPVAVAVDGNGGVYVSGTTWGSATGYREDIVTVAYDANGVERWVRQYDGPGRGLDQPADIAVDARGYVTITGSSLGTNSGFDIVTIRYAPDGTVAWERRYNGGGDGSDAAVGLCLDAAGDAYIAGNTFRTRSGFDMLTLKYDAGGQLRWQALYDSGEKRGDFGRAVAADAFGRVFVVGHSFRALTSIDYATVAYDAAHGKRLAEARYDGPSSNIDAVNHVGTDARGNVYAAGFSDPATRQIPDFAVLKYRLDPPCAGAVGRFGRPCPDSGGTVNALDWSGCPGPGETVGVAMATGATGACLLAIGLSNTAWAGFSLPLALDPLGAPGCRVYASPDVLVPFSPNAGRGVTARLALPSLSTTPATVYLQGLHLDAAANALGVVTSGGLDVTIR